MQIYGYVRVSSADQNEERQLAAIRSRKSLPATCLWTSFPARILIALPISA